MGRFASSQLARLNALFLGADEASIAGTIIAPGSLPFNRAVSGAFATGAQGAKADSAYAWGDHALANYAPFVHTHDLSAITDFDGSAYATAAQGTKADTAFGWGDHAAAGYLSAAPVLKKERLTGSTASSIVLAATPYAGSAVVVFKNGVPLIEGGGLDYTVSAATITLAVALIVSDDVTILYSAV